MISHNEIIEKIKQLPIISRFDRSMEYPTMLDRYVFSLFERPDESSAIEALRVILQITGFEFLFEQLIHTAQSIQRINKTRKLPLYGVGFSFKQGKTIQLKVYYMLTIVESDEEDIMPKFDDKANVQVIQHLLKELKLEDKAQEVNSLISYMNDNGNNMHIIGLNVERDRPLSLKVYFKMRE